MPGKRDRSVRSSTDSDTTPKKSKITIYTSNYFTNLEVESSNDSEKKKKDNVTPKISSFFAPLQKSKMAEQQLAASTTPWLFVKNELLDSMRELNNNFTRSMKETLDDLSHKFNDLVESNHFLEATFNDTRAEATLAVQQVKILTDKIADQDSIIQQQKKIACLEAYSKFYNLTFFNIPETPNETTDILLQRLHHILQMMELDPAHFYIDAMHRLPSSGRGPRPIIVKFISKLDRELVCGKKAILGKTGSTVYIREHFDESTERNIRKLLPIRRAALNQGKKV